jgi:hypothetical protein
MTSLPDTQSDLDDLTIDPEFFDKIRENAMAKLVELRIAREDARIWGAPGGAQNTTEQLLPANSDARWRDLYDKLVKTMNKAVDNDKYDELYTNAKSVISLYISLFQAIGTISALGAGFIFTVIFSDIKPSLEISNPDELARVTRYIRNCLMVAWLLFVLGTWFASIAVAIISIFRPIITTGWAKKMKQQWYKSFALAAIVCGILVLTLVPLGAFLAVSLALRSYNNAIGLTAIVSLTIIGSGMIALWVFLASL